MLLSPKASDKKLPVSLIQVSPQFYRDLYDSWKDTFREVYNTDNAANPVASFNMYTCGPNLPAYFVIDSTFQEDIGNRDIRDAYRSLFYKIFSHPFTDSVDVMSFGKWVGKYTRFLETPVDDGFEHGKVVDMVDTASSVKHKFHYMKATFSNRETAGSGDRASMDFVEIDGNIVGYALRIPREFANFFYISSTNDNWTYAYGLWVPK
ncbi:MAG: hypothetical protein HY831_02685 [Candidatus Aenigmarchaeota archaeon]|nr:hypothetical protein [Candidatus Aenigmarchaeota archaeon]